MGRKLGLLTGNGQEMWYSDRTCVEEMVCTVLWTLTGEMVNGLAMNSKGAILIRHGQ